MRKSNWSDLLSALAMSARERVRRLLESAMMNARAVISAMKTGTRVRLVDEANLHENIHAPSHALQNRIGAGLGMRCVASCYSPHDLYVPSAAIIYNLEHEHHVRLCIAKRAAQLTLTSGSLFMTFLMRASGSWWIL